MGRIFHPDENYFSKKFLKPLISFLTLYPLLIAILIIYFDNTLVQIEAVAWVKLELLQINRILERYENLQALNLRLENQYLLSIICFSFFGLLNGLLLAGVIIAGYTKTNRYDLIDLDTFKAFGWLVFSSAVVIYVFIFYNFDFSEIHALRFARIIASEFFAILLLMATLFPSLLLASFLVIIYKI